jgi:hypothetical protein
MDPTGGEEYGLAQSHHHPDELLVLHVGGVDFVGVRPRLHREFERGGVEALGEQGQA